MPTLLKPLKGIRIVSLALNLPGAALIDLVFALFFLLAFRATRNAAS